MEIKFIDSDNNELFTIKDGERIVIEFGSGETNILKCRYVDENHFSVNGNKISHQEFAKSATLYDFKYEPLKNGTEELEITMLRAIGHGRLDVARELGMERE
jgi:hypothetical protein